MEYLLGCDVSSYQGEMDWQLAKDNGIAFAFIRACFGSADMDKQFKRNWAETKRLGIPRGAYIFLLSYQNIQTQADRFLAQMGGDYGELPMVIDVEYWKSRDNVYISQPWFSQIEAFRKIIEDRTGHATMIYSSPGYWNYLAGAKEATHLMSEPVWVANYSTSSAPTILKPWDTWTFWQYTENADGYKYGTDFGSKAIDLDYYNGDWAKFAKQFKLEGSEELPEDPNEKHYVKVTGTPLRCRAKPIYVYGDSALILKDGQILEKLEKGKTYEETEYEAASDITWRRVIMYVSNKYVKDV